jgi:ParB-like chromosome segregation protein Spo0J
MTISERKANRIEQWPVERLRPYERNAKIHSPAQIGQIAESIKRFGFNNPILVDSADGIIAGHGRFAGAQKLGLRSVPVIVLDHLSDAERRAYIIADNRIAENAVWDQALLTEELQDIGDLLELTGFDQAEFEALLRKQSPPEEFPEYDESVETEHKCPKCGYVWSGAAS